MRGELSCFFAPVPRLVLFDIDGTLIRTGGAGMAAFDRVFTSTFQKPGAARAIQFSGRTDTSIVRGFFVQQGIEPSPANFQRFFEPYHFWLDHVLRETEGRVLPGVVELIDGLRALPEPPAIGLLTGNVRLGAEIKLRHYGIWEHFELGAFGDDHEDRNQLAVIARERGGRHLRRALQGEEIVVVGDTPHDVRCAQAINARCLAVATGGATWDELAAHKPAWLVEDLSKVTPAALRA